MCFLFKACCYFNFPIYICDFQPKEREAQREEEAQRYGKCACPHIFSQQY